MNNPEFTPGFSDRLKELREKHELSIHQMAAKARISYQDITDYEEGTKQPSIFDVELIARSLGCSQDWLMKGNAPKTPIPDEKEETVTAPIPQESPANAKKAQATKPQSTPKLNPETNSDGLSVRMKGLRKKTGLSQDAIGGIIGIGQYYGNIERGQEIPWEPTLAKIAKYWGTTIEWLQTGEGDAPKVTPKKTKPTTAKQKAAIPESSKPVAESKDPDNVNLIIIEHVVSEFKVSKMIKLNGSTKEIYLDVVVYHDQKVFDIESESSIELNLGKDFNVEECDTIADLLKASVNLVREELQE